MASLPVMSDVFSTADFCGTDAIASAMSALPGDFGGNFRLVLAADVEAVRAVRAILDPVRQRAQVGGPVLAPRLPLAGVVLELRLVHHGDAVLLRADGLAHAAAAAGFQIRVVEAVGRDVEAGVRTLQPAQSTLDTLLEVDHRPHGARRPLLEGLVAAGAPAADVAVHRVGHRTADRNGGDG